MAACEAACGALERFPGLSWPSARRVMTPKTPMNSSPWAHSQKLITDRFYLCTISHGRGETGEM
jgi:hypothetical protein